MSNDSPFVAPGGDGSAPLQAPPVEQAQVSAFGAAMLGSVTQPPPAAPGAGFGYAGIPAAAPQPPKANRALPIVTGVLAFVYVALCVAELFEVNHRISLLNQLTGDVGADADLLSRIDSVTHTQNTLYWIALLFFLSVIVVVSIWMSRLRKTWAATGRYHQLLKDSGYQIFRATWVASLLLSVFLRGGASPQNVQDAISHDHRIMVYFGIRAALGLVLIYFAIRFARLSARVQMLTQAGYSQEAVDFLR